MDHIEQWGLFRKRTAKDRLEAMGYHCKETRYVAYFQLVKMARLIDYTSPCLNLCTILDEDLDSIAVEDSWADFFMFLSLNQVRRHGNHP
jgi:hypothetical protein